MKYKNTRPYAIGLITLSSSLLSASADKKAEIDNMDNILFMPNWVMDVVQPFSNATCDIFAKYYTLQEEQKVEEIDPQIVTARKSATDRSIVYEYDNGQTMTRKNGTRAWRNNNPGNLVYGQFARENGAVGTDGKFAIFPTEEIGMQALRQLLCTEKYQKLTISSAIDRYAPPYGNDTVLYKRQLKKLTGLPISTRLSALSNDQLMVLATAIRKIEGWVVGKENHSNATATANKPPLAITNANAVMLNNQKQR